MVRITTLLLVYFTSLLLLLTQFPHTCHCKTTAPLPPCGPSSCGNIHNIRHPFRLTTDPKGCGDRRYELSCENNAAVVSLYPHRYYVESIDYDNFTVRHLHPALCAAECSPPLPLYSITIFDFRLTDPYSYYKRKWRDPELTTPVVFLTCAKPMDSPLFLNTPADLCISRGYSSQNTSTPSNSSSLSSSSSVFSYFRVGRLNASDVGDTCRIDMMAFTSSSAFTDSDDDHNNNLTLSEIRSALAYGFELNWFTCRNCTGIVTIILTILCSAVAQTTLCASGISPATVWRSNVQVEQGRHYMLNLAKDLLSLIRMLLQGASEWDS